VPYNLQPTLNSKSSAGTFHTSSIMQQLFRKPRRQIWQ